MPTFNMARQKVTARYDPWKAQFKKTETDQDRQEFVDYYIRQLIDERIHATNARRWQMVLQFAIAVLTTVASALTGAVAGSNGSAVLPRQLAVVFTVLAGIIAQGIIAFRPGERWRTARQLVNALELAGQDYFAGPKSTDRWQKFTEAVRTARLNFGETYLRVLSPLAGSQSQNSGS
jgi:Protein of unknown function (DUF4231)